jgi:hypothetical protein
MKALLILALTFATSVVRINAADPAPVPDPQVAAVVKEIQTQQAQIADNQAKINAKLAAVIETVRVARIFSSRGGR